MKGEEAYYNNIDKIYLKLTTEATEFLLRDLMCEFTYYRDENIPEQTITFKQSK